ncbi:MAG: hypothetical protein QOE03_3033 [Micromonosporaceae bacterium]|nr:hypothetical protein [Micromonosporaceae bacterium]
MTILLPMYVHPLEDPDAWATLPAYAGSVTAVVNVHDGPGEGLDGTYRVVTETLRGAGVDMIGYVDLDYGARDRGDVRRDIAGWGRYPVSGLFFDRVAADASGLDGVARTVRAAGCPVVLNPGTRPHPGYAGLAATVCTFEGPWSTYRAAATRRDWANAAHLVYGVPVAALDEAESLIWQRVSCGLVTDLAGANPYRGLPANLRRGAGTR